jgi:hypothetical protein
MANQIRLLPPGAQPDASREAQPRAAGADGPNFVPDGFSKYFTYYYDTRLGDEGPALVAELRASADDNYDRLTGLFGVPVPPLGDTTAFIVLVEQGSSGGHHLNCRNPQIYLDAFSGQPGLVPFLLIAEESEVFMAVQAAGWDCAASNGEGLSRILATEFYPGNLTPAGAVGSFATAHFWLDSDRPDWVSKNENSDTQGISLGCSVLFINYLRFQLGFSLQAIIRAGGATLAETYQKLTGRTDAFGPFAALLARYFPSGRASNLATDNPFPLGTWERLPGGQLFSYPPAIHFPDDSARYVYAVGADSQLYRSTWRSSWQGWEPLGGSLAGTPSVVSRKPGVHDVFAVGTDSALWHRTWDGTAWSGWTSHGGSLQGDVAAVSLNANRIDVVGRGHDSQLWHIFWNGTSWSQWTPRGGPILSGPSAVGWGPSRLLTAALSPASGLLVQTYDLTKDTWGGWLDLGGQLTSPPVIAMPGIDHPYVFARGTDSSLQQRFWDGHSWGSRFSSIGGVLTCDPKTMASSPAHIEVLASQLDHSVGRVFWDGSNWGRWTGLGGLVASTPIPSAHAEWVYVDVFVLGMDSGIWHQRYA